MSDVSPKLLDEITQDVRDYAATLNDPDKRAVAGLNISGVIEDGMAGMAEKFREMGGSVYVEAEKRRRATGRCDLMLPSNAS